MPFISNCFSFSQFILRFRVGLLWLKLHRCGYFVILLTIFWASWRGWSAFFIKFRKLSANYISFFHLILFLTLFWTLILCMFQSLRVPYSFWVSSVYTQFFFCFVFYCRRLLVCQHFFQISVNINLHYLSYSSFSIDILNYLS